MSVVTYAELRAGLEMQPHNRDHDEEVLALLVQRIPVVPFAEAAAKQFGILRTAIRDRRRDALDRLIAAHAIAAGAVLITNNEADFRHYPRPAPGKMGGGLTGEDSMMLNRHQGEITQSIGWFPDSANPSQSTCSARMPVTPSVRI